MGNPVALNSLLLPAIGGYWLLTHWYFTSFRAERDSGYHLLLRSAFFGIALYLVADAVRPDLANVLGDPFIITLRGSVIFVLDMSFFALLFDKPPPPLTGTALLSLVLGIVGPGILNLLTWKGYCVKRTANQFGDHVELLLERAVNEQILVEVGLRSRRTYVGFVQESGVGKTLNADAKLVPVYSGRRDHETLRLDLDTDYSLISTQLNRSDRHAGTDAAFVVPLSEIVSVRLFDEEAYNATHEIVEPKRGARDTSSITISASLFLALTFSVVLLVVLSTLILIRFIFLLWV